MALSPEERTVIQHFQETHTRNDTGRFIVPLPRKPQRKPLGESRSQASGASYLKNVYFDLKAYFLNSQL